MVEVRDTGASNFEGPRSRADSSSSIVSLPPELSPPPSNTKGLFSNTESARSSGTGRALRRLAGALCKVGAIGIAVGVLVPSCLVLVPVIIVALPMITVGALAGGILDMLLFSKDNRQELHLISGGLATVPFLPVLLPAVALAYVAVEAIDLLWNADEKFLGEQA